MLPELSAPLLSLLAIGACMFIVGGIVKGTLGVGLPLVVVPMLSLVVPAPQAMGLLVTPVLSSNLWQALEGGRFGFTMRRFAALIVAQFVTTLLTVKYTQGLSLKTLNVLIALIVVSAVVLMLVRPRGEISPRLQAWTHPLVGVIAGVMGGISSLTGPIIIAYLVALRLKREEFIGSISVIYLFGSVPMYGAMLWFGRFGWQEAALSLVALAPMFIGLKIGTSIRHRLSERLFRGLLYAFLTLLAVLLLFK